MPPRQFGWLDSPDGEDIIKKTNLAAKVGFVTGTPIALFDHFMNPQKNMKGYAFRATYCILPFVGAGAAFALTSQGLSKQFPKTKPEVWYLVGGVAAGTVLGGALRSPRWGAVISFYLACTAAFVRDMCNYPLEGFMANLPKQLNNDEELFQADYRINPQPITQLPLPYARPAKPHSDLGFY